MVRFFRVSDNSFHTRGFPWIARIEVGLEHKGICPECGGSLTQPRGDLQVALERNKGSKWPDAIGCGHYPLLVVSARVLSAWRNAKLGDFPVGGMVTLLPPFPKKLEKHEPPVYCWLDGAMMFGARLDFEASGFVGVQFCSRCSRRWDDIPATFQRQHSQRWGYVFWKGSWKGANLFTTDISPTAFFCTNAVVESAKEHALTNFRFIPVEEGVGAGSPGVEYLLPKSPNG